MRIQDLKPGVVVTGPVLPEPVELAVINTMGDGVQIMGKGLTTGQFYDQILSTAQIELLEGQTGQLPFDGDGQRFRLGVEAMRLGLAL